MRCENCGRLLSSNIPKTHKCKCGHTQLIVRMTHDESGQLYRNHLKKHLPICEACDHWRDASCGTGCGLLKKPCNITKHLLTGFGCVDCPQKFRAADRPPTKPGFVSDMMAVTSLGPDTAHQRHCIQTWKEVGFRVVCVQSKEEVARLKRDYRWVDYWIADDDNDMPFNKKTQRIWRLCMVARDSDCPILLCNADIEMYGDVNDLNIDLSPNVLTFGSRWNYDRACYSQAQVEEYGIDAFVITPAMADTIPNIPLGIGNPVWDYWLPMHFMRRGYEIKAIAERFFYHRRHEQQWLQTDWTVAADVVEDCYGVRISPDFRKLLPPAGRPPKE